MADLKEYLDFAVEAVRGTGLLDEDRTAIRSYKNGIDPVTEGDLYVEERIVGLIQQKYPGHGIISEERDEEHGDAEWVWVLDPIDGTKYYARGVPLYSISLALRHEGEEVVGAVYSPAQDRIYAARRGGGATMNGEPIACSSAGDLSSCTVFAEIPGSDSGPVEVCRALDDLRTLIAAAFRVRILGAGALGFCLLASGGIDVYANLGSIWKEWDIAAGKLIAREAGAGFAPLGGGFVAAPDPLFDTVLDLLKC